MINLSKCSRALLIIVVCTITTISSFAQPVNDNCISAIPIVLSIDKASIVKVSGDTRGASGDMSVPNVCSACWFMDDIWFSITLPAEIPSGGIVVKTYFQDEEDDIPAVGMALYASCDTSSIPWSCFSSYMPEDDQLYIGPNCLIPGFTYYIRVWSGASPHAYSGTFRIGAYGMEKSQKVLWEEQFDDGLSGWTASGTCSNPDSNANAKWKYLPQGFLNKGNFGRPGFRIESPSWCNGAIGVDSDYDDNRGTDNSGSGPCPAPAQYIIESPAIFTGDWEESQISVTWIQAIRQFKSSYFVSFRTAETGGSWSDWNDREVNTEFETIIMSESKSRAKPDDYVHVFLGGATNGDSLQLRFIYNANYYLWGIDDIRIVPAETNNMRSMSNYFAIAPALNVPRGNQRNFYGINDVYNSGAATQANVNLNLTIVDPANNVIYDENISCGTMTSDSLSEHKPFAKPIDYTGGWEGQYRGIYTVTSDSTMEETDFDWSDNQNSFTFGTNSNGYYQLEDGYTTAMSVASNAYDEGAPYSYTWGNYFYFPNGSWHTVNKVLWGLSNPSDLAGQSINVILFKWVDLNNDQIAQAYEREILGFDVVDIVGDEEDNIKWESELENFSVPGERIILEDNGEYFVMIEYNATKQVKMFLHASEKYDYTALSEISDQVGDPIYTSVFGFSPDGKIQGIEYILRPPDSNGVFFGHNVIPSISLKVNGGYHAADIDKPVIIQIEAYPNPATLVLNVDLDFSRIYDEIQIHVTDISGSAIETRTLKNVKQETFELNVEHYISGAYILDISARDESRTIKFIVQH